MGTNIDPALKQNQMTLDKLIQYQSKDMKQFKSTLKNFKRAAPVFGWTLLGVGVSMIAINLFAKYSIFGTDGKGGNILNIYSKQNQDDIRYNREFQRMNYLSEPNRPKPGHREMELSLAKEIGEVKVNPPIDGKVKFSPHYKYF